MIGICMVGSGGIATEHMKAFEKIGGGRPRWVISPWKIKLSSSRAPGSLTRQASTSRKACRTTRSAWW